MSMSELHYIKLHELVNQLQPRRIEGRVEAPRRRHRPQPKQNEIYFIYQTGEKCHSGNNIYDRIVYVGKSEDLRNRLKSYTRFFPPLHNKVRESLATQKGVSEDAISLETVVDYVKTNFRWRVLLVPSADEAKIWEKKIIPTIAHYSSAFVSEGWLGNRVDKLRHHGVWNTADTSSQLTLEDKDLHELHKLITDNL